MSEQDRHQADTFGATEESTDEPDVEAHLQDAFMREDTAADREQTDAAEERHREDLAT